MMMYSMTGTYLVIGQKSGLVGSDSRTKGCRFESHLILGGNGVKAMPGSIIVPNTGSFNK